MNMLCTGLETASEYKDKTSCKYSPSTTESISYWSCKTGATESSTREEGDYDTTEPVSFVSYHWERASYTSVEVGWNFSTNVSLATTSAITPNYG